MRCTVRRQMPTPTLLEAEEYLPPVGLEGEEFVQYKLEHICPKLSPPILDARVGVEPATIQVAPRVGTHVHVRYLAIRAYF